MFDPSCNYRKLMTKLRISTVVGQIPSWLGLKRSILSIIKHLDF